ncbi:MAG TPA: aminotransferase class V-fold PLP-dependent enzyme [Anaerolineae bacterium]
MPYFDNAATSFPKPESVYRAMDDFMRTRAGNPGRGTHRLSLAAGEVVDETRQLLAQLFHAPDPNRVIFAANTTDALNLALHGLLKPGDHVVTTTMEHNAVVRPLRTLSLQGVRVTRVGCAPDGSLRAEQVLDAMLPDTRLVVMIHASNVSGTVLPVAEVGAAVRERGALLLVDAAQTAGVLPIDVQAMQVDLLAFPGHKGLFGPPGTGGLVVGERARLRPVRQGGTGTLSEQEDQPSGLPEGLETGTLNSVGIAGLGAGVRFILEQGTERICAHELAIVQRLLAGLRSLPGIQLYGPPDSNGRVGVVSVRLEHWEPMDLGVALDQEFDIAVRTGLHCAPLAHRTLGTLPTGTVRLAPGYFTTVNDVDRVIDALRYLSAQWERGVPRIEG